MVRKSTWIVLALFLLLAGGAYLYSRSQQPGVEATPAASEDLGYLLDLPSPLSAVRIEQVGGRMIELERDGHGQWQIRFPAGLQADPQSAESTLAQLATVQVISRLENAPDLAAMGLDQPAYRLLLTGQDGKQTVANVGKLTPTGSGYYVLVSGRGAVVANRYVLDSVLGLAENPPLLPTPEPALPAAPETPPAAP
ncbi:MAG: DUF4340 domain-containing protein [Chloroflexota bacterium]